MSRRSFRCGAATNGRNITRFARGNDVVKIFRVVILFEVTVVIAMAQFVGDTPYAGLATSYDGGVLYFASRMRIKGSGQPFHGKLFVADDRGGTPVPFAG
jgi:hypothetical protein